GTAANGAVTVRAGKSAAGALTVNEAVSTVSTTADTAGGTVVLESDGALTLASSGTLTTSGFGNANGGQVFVHNAATTSAGDITLGKNVTAAGAGTGNGGVVTVLNENGAILVNATVDVSGTSDGTIGLKASGDITDGASGLLKGDTDGELLAQSPGGKITLDLTAGHQMATVALKTDTAAGTDGTIKYYDANDVTIGTAGGAGTLSAVSGANASSVGAFSGVKTVAGTAANGAVTVRAGKSAAGALTVNEAVSTVSTTADTAGGTVVLESDGALTLASSGTLTTSGFGNANGGQVFVHNAATTSAGDITLGKNVTAAGAGTGNGGVVTVLNENGAILVNATVDVSGTSDGTIGLKASGDITDGASGLLKGDTDGELLAQSPGGKITLDLTAGHQMATVALKTDTAAGTDGTIKYYDANDVTIGTAGGAGTLSAVSGANASSVGAFSGVKTVAGTAANGAVTVRAGKSAAGALTVNEAVSTVSTTADTAGGTVVLESDGALTLASSGTLTTSGFGNANGGQVFVHNAATTSAGDITLGKNVTAAGAGTGNGGVVTVLNENGAILVNATVDVSGTSDGTIGLKASGDITDGASGLLKGDTDGKLLAQSTGGKITLDLTAGHQMATVALKTDTAAGTDGTIKYYDANDVTIGTAGGAGTLSAVSGANASSVGAFSGVKTVAGTAANGAVTVRAGKSAAGALTVNEAVSTVSTTADTAGGTVVLESDGALTLASSGTLTTSGFGNANGGQVFVHNAATTSAGDITLGKNVTAAGAGTGNGGVVTVLNENGAILVNATVDVSGTSDGTIGLKA